jgi:ubiquinone/menaquinone biosynthesis C-methylase UbiE
MWCRKRPAGEKRITFMHGVFEDNTLPSASFDVVVFNFVIHECPQKAIQDFMAGARRLLKPGGVLCFVDNNPRSETIQNLPPALFTLMKSTEPWSDEYYSFDVEGAMRETGYSQVETVATDHRHRSVFGMAP